MNDENVIIANSALESVSFDNLIGAPLGACISAQQQAAQTTMDFIKMMGFEESDSEKEDSFGKARMICFEYNTPQGKTAIKVPLLSIIPVPYLQIDNVDIEFTADVTATSEDTFSAKIASTSRNSETNNKANMNYQSLVGIKIHASNGNMPAGLAKILQLFGNEGISEEIVGDASTVQVQEEELEKLKQERQKLEEEVEKLKNDTKKYMLVLQEKPTNNQKLRITSIVKKFVKEAKEEDIIPELHNGGVVASNVSLEIAELINDEVEKSNVDIQIIEM